MGQSTFPVPSSGSSTSTVLPINASSVILDGSLTSGTSYTTTVNGNGGPAYLVANVNAAAITISGTQYVIPAGSTVASKAFGSSTSVKVAAATFASTAPTSLTIGSGYTAIGGAYIGMAYGNGTYVTAQSQTSSTVGNYSTNGTTWTPMTMPSSSNWLSITYGNGLFVATASGTAAGYSSNGYTWTSSTMPSSGSWQVAAGGGYFVAVQGSGTYTAYYSTNGSTWNTTSITTTAGTLGSITYGNGYFVTIDSSSGGAAQSDGAYSSNATTWTNMSLSASQIWCNVTYGNGTFAATAANGAITYSTSTPPSSWSNGTSSAITSGNNTIVYGNGYWLTTGAGSTTAKYTTSLTGTWTNVTIASAAAGGGSVYGNGVFVNSRSGIYYYSQAAVLPVNFGIYNGPTTVN